MHIMLDDGKTASPLKLVLLCVAAVLVPWVWGVWAMPLWVALVSLLLSVAAVFLVLWQFKSHAAAVRTETAAVQQAELRQADSAGEAEQVLREMMGAWLSASQTAGANLQKAHTLLDEVTQQSEAAATSIGKSFQQIGACRL